MLKKEDINFEIKKTNIAKVIYEKYGKQSNHYFLSSRLRKSIIYSYAGENRYNKIELVHHLDNAIKTFFLNTFLSNRISFIKPHYVNDKRDVSVIRPLYSVWKKKLINLFLNFLLKILILHVLYHIKILEDLK